MIWEERALIRARNIKKGNGLIGRTLEGDLLRQNKMMLYWMIAVVGLYGNPNDEARQQKSGDLD